MKVKEAIDCLSDGHTIWTVSTARKICDAVDVQFREEILVRTFKSDPPGTFKGLTMNPGNENTLGVYALDLSSYVAEQFGVRDKARSCYGRGSQARAYATVIEETLKNKKQKVKSEA